MKKLIALTLALAPLSTFAQSQIRNINDIFSTATSLGNTITVLLVSFAVIYIVYSVVRYLIATNDNEARKQAGWNILWGVVGLFVIVSLWGLVNILSNSFRTDESQINVNEIPKALTPPAVR